MTTREQIQLSSRLGSIQGVLRANIHMGQLSKEFIQEMIDAYELSPMPEYCADIDKAFIEFMKSKLK